MWHLKLGVEILACSKPIVSISGRKSSDIRTKKLGGRCCAQANATNPAIVVCVLITCVRTKKQYANRFAYLLLQTWHNPQGYLGLGWGRENRENLITLVF
jgi:hypothetical protein